MICNNNSLYGNYRTRKFTDIFPDATTFVASYNLGITNPSYTITEAQAEFVYYLLYSKYGNSHIASSDENQFKFRLSTLIMQFGPTFFKKLQIQEELRSLSIEELQAGSFQISNHAFNPSTAPSTDSLTQLTKIDQQNTNRWQKSKPEAYNLVLALLDDDLVGDFISNFKRLFITIVEPDCPLWYVSEE